MVDFFRNVAVGVSVEILDSFPAEADGANVRVEIYQRSTGYYWKSDSSSFASGQAYTAMTRIIAKTWRVTFTPNIADTYICSIYVEGNLRNIHYLQAQGGVTTAGAGTGWNLGQLRTLWRRIIKDNEGTEDADITDLLNMAKQDIDGEEKGHWRYLEDDFTITTVASQTTPYSIDSDINEIIDMRITSPSEHKLTHFPGGWQNFVRWYPKHTDTGTPDWYIPYGVDGSGILQVAFYLWPSTVMTIYGEGYKKPGTLTADGDVPEMPQIFQSILVIRAAWYEALRRGDTLASRLDNEYQKGIFRMKLWNRNKLDQTDDIPRHDIFPEVYVPENPNLDSTSFVGS